MNTTEELRDPSVWEMLRLTFSPDALVNRIPLSGGLIQPMLFAASITSVPVGLLALASAFIDGQTAFDLLAVAACMPVCYVAIALIIHLQCKLLGGRGSYESTLRAIIYTSIPRILLLISIVGIPFSLYGLYLTAKAVKRAHGFGVKRATSC